MTEVIRYNEIVLGADPEDPAFKELPGDFKCALSPPGNITPLNEETNY